MTIRQRQDALIRSLRRAQTTTVATLAHDLGVSRRTILRDLNALRDEGFIIHADAGRGGGLRLDPSSAQITARLSVSEIFALLISVETMCAAGGIPFNHLAGTALAKLEKALPSDKIHDLRRFLNCLYIGELAKAVDISDMGQMDDDLLPAFEKVFLERQHLKFTYRDRQGQVSTRTVEPQAMLILPPLWYLVAWDPGRQGFRHFRMDRISNTQCLEGPKFRRRHVPFDDHISPVRS